MNALITAEQILQAVPEASVDQQSELPATITAIAEGFCGRPLVYRATVEEHLPDADGEFRLRCYPVDQISDLRSLPSPALTISYQGVAVYDATVRFRFDDQAHPETCTGLALLAPTGDADGLTLIPFAPAEGTPLRTVQALAMAINAQVGWHAGVTAGQELCPVALLRAFRWPQSALVAPVRVLAFTRPISLRGLLPATGHAAVAAGTTFHFGSQPTLDSNTVRVAYTAGYNADPAVGLVNLPADLVEACRQMARAILDQRKVSGVIGQVGLGNTSVSAADRGAALTPAVRGLLNRFVEIL